MELPVLFFLISMLYSSIGFGGGSSYLAILALYSLEFTSIRAIALICNITVVSGNILIFEKQKLIPWSKILPLVLWSVPLAFIGGYIPIRERWFFIILSITLLLAGGFMIFQYFKMKVEIRDHIEISTISNGVIGGAIGFLSGLVGIGGGIFLAPLLHMIKWDKTKLIAATASVFILVNSLAGLTGQIFSNTIKIDWELMMSLIIAVFFGGQLGSRISAKKMDAKLIKLLTAILIIFVSIRILYKYF